MNDHSELMADLRLRREHEAADEIEKLRGELAHSEEHREQNRETAMQYLAERDAAVKALEQILIECRNTGYGSAVVMERMIDRIEEFAELPWRR